MCRAFLPALPMSCNTQETLAKRICYVTLVTSLLLHLNVQTVPHAVPLHGQGALNTAYTNLPLNIHVCSA